MIMAIEKQIETIDLSAASYASKTTVVGQEDIPALGVREMQESVEYMPRNFIIPVLNKVIQFLNGTYSKTETDEAINNKVTEIGAGDMAKGVYDPEGAVQEVGGIAAYVQNKVSPAVSGVESAKGISVALDPSKWSSSAPYTQTVSVEWMTADWKAGCPALDVESCNGNVEQIMQRQEEFAKLDMVSSSSGALTFTAFEEKPGTWLDINIPRFVSRGE